ncbi:putative late blight resistance protein homolog R1B-23 [Solanum dulcamara]|uniref:putative late blight resistance protein homolog R1B-23 n=1 Tax=Solanum dulcamara TaxID=45834 RepID=UPI0024866B89|nr:putative late blight resistance protein homolog R1B-23 [Solanum dulcamara]XP_055810077.1 putative late blight resistance protein homolog R1B-23 [Solanum dulcamara]
MSSDKYLYVKKLIPFEPLQQIEDSWAIVDMPATSMDQIKLLKREFKFIDCFLCLHNLTDESNMLDDVTLKIQILFQDAGVDLNKVYRERLRMVYSMYLQWWNPIIDTLIGQVQDKIQMIKSDIRAKYSFPKISLAPNYKIVLEFMDDVLWILNDLVPIDDPEPKEKIKEVIKELNLLRFFVCFVSNKHREPQRCQHTFFTHVLAVSGHAAIVAWLHLPSRSKENQDILARVGNFFSMGLKKKASEMNLLLSELLQMKIKPIQPGIRKIYIDVLQALKSTIQSGSHPNKEAADCGSAETLPHNLALNDQMEILREMLSLLRANLVHLPILDLEFHLQDMEVVIINAGLLIYSLYDSEGEKEDTMLEDVNQTIGLDLPSNIHHIKEMVYLIIRKVFQSNLPRIHGLGYVDFLLSNLEKFQGCYSGSLASVMNQLQIIQKELESAQPFLENVVEQQHNKHNRFQHWAMLLIGKAYEVEYVVDACIRKELPHWCVEHWLSDIIDDITLLTEKIAIKDKKILNPASHDTRNTASTETSEQLSRALMMNEEIVGFEDVTEELRDKLTKGCRELDVISIVGMPGLGKTTLAKKLFYDKSIVEYFDIRAQCCVSQVHKRVDLLLSIFHDATGMSPSSSTEDDVADKLRKTLLPKRYLILVDDVWETRAWDDLICCFEDANKGSRIILTTRHRDVAEHARFHSDPLHLRLFNDDESWELLKSKAIGEERYSHPGLEEVGRKIAIKCGGLPLSIVLVAGILAKMEKKEESWKQVATTLGSLIHNDSKDIVEQSYQDLSCHLKPCFLYFGGFLEDRVIDVTTLTRLWISEAFIKSCKGKRLEDIAEGYLDSLIGRNLVMVAQRDDSDGKVKACRLHDVLLAFCKERAKEENFLLWIKRDQNANPFSCIHSHKQHAQRRLAFCEVDTLEKWSSSCSLVGSVLFRNDTTFFALNGLSLQHFTISRILQTFKFLKVLDLEHSVIIDFFPTNLVHLRYFAAGTRQRSIPSSIANLWNLETLILYRENDDLVIPNTIWKLAKLRHLHTFHSIVIVQNAEELPEYSSKLNDLDTFSTPSFSCVKDAELMLRKMPNIRELRCSFRYDQRHLFPVLDFPTRLETLNIFGSIPPNISASNLKKLILNSCELHLSNLRNIAQLQNLQALELRTVEFRKVWKVSNDEFPQLKVLKLEYLSLIEWTVADEAFGNLECLFLSYCTYLKGIPSCFGDICTLKYIEVENCNEIVAQSARDIREKQVEDYSNTDFKLFIKEL